MALGPWGTISEWTIACLSSGVGARLPFPTHTSYEWEDHTLPKGGLGVPLNHPRFLEWLGTPDTAWLLEMSPGHWCDTLTRDRALTAAMQLHKDACLMQSNLDILDQYALALHGTASTILQWTIGGGSFPGTEVLTGAPGAHARRVSVQMEALGLWRPTLDPLQFVATWSWTCPAWCLQRSHEHFLYGTFHFNLWDR